SHLILSLLIWVTAHFGFCQNSVPDAPQSLGGSDDQACSQRTELIYWTNLISVFAKAGEEPSPKVRQFASQLDSAQHDPVMQTELLPNIREELSRAAHTIDDNSQPMPLKGGALLANPRAKNTKYTPPLTDSEKIVLIQRAGAVGRLAFQTRNPVHQLG